MKTIAHNTGSELPAELQRSLPREVELSATGRAAVAAAILLVAAALILGVWLSSKAEQDARRWQAWQSEAVTVQGQVTNLRKRGSGDDTKYYADYFYQAGERRYAGTTTVRKRAWRQMKPGDAIAVFYRQSEPSRNWTARNQPTGVPPWAGLLVALSLIIPAPLLVYAVRRQRRLLEEGRSARARVTARKKISSQHGSQNVVWCEFPILSGARRTGKYNAGRKPPEIGDEILVIYHPDEENWSARYPLTLVRVRE